MIIDGKKFAQELRNEIKKEIESIKKTSNTTPGLTVVLVGNHTPSEIYVRNKELSAKEVGITSEVIRFESSITEEKLIEVIHGLNKDKKVHGILVQLPLPPHINGSKIIEEIDPKKDVDGFHPVNVGNLSSSSSAAAHFGVLLNGRSVGPAAAFAYSMAKVKLGTREFDVSSETIEAMWAGVSDADCIELAARMKTGEISRVKTLHLVRCI